MIAILARISWGITLQCLNNQELFKIKQKPRRERERSLGVKKKKEQGIA